MSIPPKNHPWRKRRWNEAKEAKRKAREARPGKVGNPDWGRKSDGTNPRALGTNPRALGTSPTQLGIFRRSSVSQTEARRRVTHKLALEHDKAIQALWRAVDELSKRVEDLLRRVEEFAATCFVAKNDNDDQS